MSDTATLQLPGQESVELPVITGSEGEKAIDVSKLRAKTGYITLDPGYVNTGSCSSSDSTGERARPMAPISFAASMGLRTWSLMPASWQAAM